MKKGTSYIVLSVIVVAGIVIDLISKIYFAKAFSSGQVVEAIPNLLRFTFVKNTGAAYGILGGSTTFLIIITIAFLIGFIAYDIFNHSQSLWYIFGVGLIVSGGIGNLIDRLFLGYVRDFISIEFFSFVFNFADLFITIGIVCFAIYLIIGLVKEMKSKKDSNGTEGK